MFAGACGPTGLAGGGALSSTAPRHCIAVLPARAKGPAYSLHAPAGS